MMAASELKTVMGKAYNLVFASVGFKSKSIKITGTDANVNVGKVLLQVSNNQLNEVAIVAAKAADEAGS